MDAFLQDLRYAARTLMKNPGFAVLTITCLALGIGVNSTIFSVVDTVAIRALPFRDPEQLVALETTQQANGVDHGDASFLDVRDWTARAHVFADIATVTGRSLTLSDTEEPERFNGATVTWMVVWSFVLGAWSLVRPRTYTGIILPMPLSAVIFDFDGIVLDSETPEFESHRRIYARCGVALTVEEWCDVIGLWSEGHDERWFRQLCERSPSAPSHDAYHAEKRGLFDEMVSREPMRGIRDLIAMLAGSGVPMAIASSAPARWVVPAAERIGVRAQFGAIVTGDEVARRKPAPDVYLEAARRLGVDPARSIAIEDSGPGLTAARAAGMKTVAIPHWLTARHDLSGAHLTVAHAGELTLARLAMLFEERR